MAKIIHQTFKTRLVKKGSFVTNQNGKPIPFQIEIVELWPYRKTTTPVYIYTNNTGRNIGGNVGLISYYKLRKYYSKV